MSELRKPVGVIGAGSFGSAIAGLLAENNPVLLFARREEVVNAINRERNHGDIVYPQNITATGNLEEIADRCDLIFPTVPSSGMRELMKEMAPVLYPHHILIHGTKGFDVHNPENLPIESEQLKVSRSGISTISEVIMQETTVVRVGCLSGPNLARELLNSKPAGTVIASPFEEVIRLGQLALRSPRFQVFKSHDLIGIELTGALKNIIAIASGALSGLEMGENARALLISKGLGEMIRIARIFNATAESFLGVAGIGDLVATATSPLSRNFTVGQRLARGEKLQEIIATSTEVAEGVHTVLIIKKLADSHKVYAPITQAVYRVLYQNLSAQEALGYLMRLPFDTDVDFLV